jgi:D-sedoheptulose 7-phosphate isomerase
VLLAAQTARIARAHTVALTGRTGGRLRKLVDLAVRVPSDVIEQVEDVHVVIAHSVCVALREQLASDTFLPNNHQDIGVDRLLGEVVGDAGS